MAKVGLLGIVVGAGILLVHGEGRDAIHVWLGHIDGKGDLVIRQPGMPDAVKPEHGSHRESEGQNFQLRRAIQVATPSAMVFYGSPESPTR
jgi:hypothetical protein